MQGSAMPRSNSTYFKNPRLTGYSTYEKGTSPGGLEETKCSPSKEDENPNPYKRRKVVDDAKLLIFAYHKMAGLTPPHKTSIDKESPRIKIQEKGVFSGADVKLLAADSPKSKHAYEDGGLAFSTSYGNFFMICDGVSGGNSVHTPLYVQTLLKNLKTEITTKFMHADTDNDASVKNKLVHILNECNTSDDIKNILLKNDEGQPSTTITILFQDKSNKLFYLMCGDSGFQVQKANGTLIDRSIGNSEPQFSFVQFLLSETSCIPISPCPNQIQPGEALDDETNIIGYDYGSIQLDIGDTVSVASDGIWDNFKHAPMSPPEFFNGQRRCLLQDSFNEFFNHVFDIWHNLYFTEQNKNDEDLKGIILSFYPKQKKLIEENFNVFKESMNDLFNINRDFFSRRIEAQTFNAVKHDDSTMLYFTVTGTTSVDLNQELSTFLLKT